MAQDRLTIVRNCFAAATAAPLLAWACASAEPVDVRFENPEKFTDVRLSSFADERTRDQLLGELREHLRAAAPKQIPAGSCLALVITNVDMAGSFEPWHGPRAADVRVIRDIYPPRIDLEFRLTDDAGTSLKEGKRNLADLSFLAVSGINRQHSLGAEKRMLDSWLRKEFAR